MTEKQKHTFIEAVNAAIGFPTVEDLLCEGKAVDLKDLKEAIGSRFILEQRKLCKSHVRRLAASIIKHKMMYVPIGVEPCQGGYKLVDGYHRLAALELIKEQEPLLHISVKVRLNY
jgi:hypothetical protein